MTGHIGNRVGYSVRAMLLCLLMLLFTRGPAAQAEELIFPLEEVSVFDLPQQARHEFLVGQRAACGDEADPNVAKYPNLASDRPIYGRVDFSAPLGPKDEARVYCFVVDESGGTDAGYDRLYFDLNRDGDLTNDTPHVVQKSPPQGAMLGYSDIKQQVCFENLALPLPCGTEGERPLGMMPRLILSDNGHKTLSFVTTKARKGAININGRKCDVLLGHCYIAPGWFDKPWTALHLTPAWNKRPYGWWGGDRLNATHKIGDTFYTFAATPAGDKLIVRPYEGPLGTFEIGAGGRNLNRLTVRGSLRSESTAVAVGTTDRSGDSQPTQSCRLPVGDYLPEYLTIQYGGLRVSLSTNYHSDGRRQNLRDRQLVYGIAIREDKPFVFDFSNKPAVMFASPARDQRAKPGEEIRVMAVLTDPIQDFMIRGLRDTARKEEKELDGPNGTKHSYTQDVSLDPKVTITRTNGEVVAEGVMPFG